MKFVIKESKEIKEVIFNKDNKYVLLEDYDECDGGIIVKISDRDIIKNDYIEMGFEENEMMFENEEGDEVGINDVVCRLDIRDRSGGYSVFYDENKNYLIEL
jgi:hypothetical protein